MRNVSAQFNTFSHEQIFILGENRNFPLKKEEQNKKKREVNRGHKTNGNQSQKHITKRKNKA